MNLSVAGFDLIFHLGMGAAMTYLAYVFLTEYGEATAELRERQVQTGDATLADAYVHINPEVFFLLRATGALILFILGRLLGGMVIGIMFGTAGFVAPYFLLRNLKQKRIKKMEHQLVEALELLGNSLKSGLTLPQATELLVKEFPPPISQEFNLVLAETRLGVEFTDALENMAKRLDSTIIYILATGVTITKRCGGDLTVIFNNIANTIRERATIEGKLEAVTAQGRFQGLILGLMPFALVIVLWFIDRQHVVTLFRYQLGIWAFTAVVIMVILAQLWIRKLLDIDV